MPPIRTVPAQRECWLLFAAAFVWGLTNTPAQDVNIAVGRPVSASGPTWGGQVPENMTDGNLNNQTHPLAASGTLGFYYEIDFGSERNFERLELVNRSGCCPERLSNYRVEVRADAGGSAGAVNWDAEIRADGSHSGDGGRDVVTPGLDPGNAMAGRYVRVVNLSNAAYNPQIAELEAYEAPLPAIAFFHTDRGNITATGDPDLPTSATLSWSVTGADSVSIDNGIGGVAATGQRSVSPGATTTYVLTASNAAGSSNASVTVGVDEAVVPPVLSEFMADNATTLDDQIGNSPDWIEIHNPNGFDLSLDGYFLTDDPNDLTKWRAPAASISANGYLVIFASGENLTDPAEPPHANFQLSRDGEYVALVDTDGTTVLGQFPADFPATMTYPPQKEDVSFGLVEGGATPVGFFMTPTPGAANGAGFAGFVADTKFDIGRGFYTDPISVRISTATADATIRYTTDGSAPTESHGTIYSGPVSISDTTVLRAFAHKPGLAPTNVDTNTYVFIDDVITSPELGVPVTQQMRDSLTAVPSLSIVSASTINGTSEVPTSFEVIHPDGTEGVQENCGVKHFGGAFTNFDKKNFRLYFRSGYGASKLRYPLFDGFGRGIAAAERFDQLNLRSGSHDMNQRGFYMSNRFTDDSMLDMGNVNPHGRFMHLYLNGRYWGVYHVRERWNASTLTEYLGGPKSDYEAINGNWNVGGWAHPVVSAYDGDGSAWERIKSLAADYDAVRPYLDVPHYIDYMIMWMFGNAEDEYRCVGPADVGSGFKWFLNDADGYLRTSAGNRTGFASNVPGVFGRSAGDGPGSIFSLLFKAGDPEYRILLADRIHKHYFHGGAMTPAQTIPRLAGRSDEMDLPFYAEAERWGYRTHASWESSKNSILNSWLPGRTATVINQFRTAGFYPATDAPAFSQHGGDVPSGFNLGMSGEDGVIYYTTDGSDPRLEGGAINPMAVQFDDATTSETLVAKGAVWNFLDDGSDQGTAWRAAGFDDSTWAQGAAELGYGENDEATVVSFGPSSSNKYITTWFRHAFTLADDTGITAATLEIKRDDGAVIFLNGSLVGASNMPGGPVTHTTTAPAAPDDGNDFHPVSVPVNLLQQGRNVLAVEIHQQAPNSSDLSFDLELRITRTGAENSALTLDEPTFVRARAVDGGQWSAVNEALFTIAGTPAVAPGDLVVSELNYNPQGADDTEFVELHNISGHAVNLRGAFFDDGIEFAFPGNRDAVLNAGERVLLVDSQFAMDRDYGRGLPVVGVYRGNLDNDGETIILLAADGATELLNFTYNDNPLWPEYADGEGGTLELLAPETAPDMSDPLSWIASAGQGGNPGTQGAGGTPFVGDPLGDLNDNGLSDIIDYYIDPRSAVLGSAADGSVEFAFVRRSDAASATHLVERSADALTWTSGGTELISRAPGAGGFEMLTYRIALSPGQSRLLARLRIVAR